MDLAQRASLVACAALAAAAWIATAPGEGAPGSDGSDRPAPLVGDARTLRAGFERWSSARGELDRLELALGWSKGRSVAYTEAQGRALFDLGRGTLSIEVAGFESDEPLEAWLVAYRAESGGGFDPRRDETRVLLGALESRSGTALLGLTRELDLAADFELERVVIARAGAGPEAGGLLFASPSLFERFAYQREGARRRGEPPGGLPLALASQAAFALRPGALSPVDFAVFEALVARGEQLFFEETFAGNGRTCGTCHPAENNTTLDPAYISTLPADDPLFVAETNPALDARLNGGLVFENPALMREHALIVVNADGYGDLRTRYTLRGVPHLLGLVRTTARAPEVEFPIARLGWGGDGAPGTGSLRDFVTAAVPQHMTRTLARAPGSDFRLPTPDELTALEAFLLSLGNPVAPDLAALALLDPAAEAGRVLFQSATGTCILCHFDAGGIPLGRTYNASVDTGVEAFTQNRLDRASQRPRDGGFGLTPDGGRVTLHPNPDGSYGNGHFGIPSVIEAADTLPAFHSSLTGLPGLPFGDTIEGAVAFYDSDEFEDAPGLGDTSIDLEDFEIVRLGAFLRAINALENERSARSLGERALAELGGAAPALERIARFAELATFECADATEVLGGIGMNPLARERFEAARARFDAARTGTATQRRAALASALELLAEARAGVALE